MKVNYVQLKEYSRKTI